MSELANLSGLRHQRLSGTFSSPIHPALWLTVVLLTFLTLINLILFNPKKSGYVAVSVASLAYALILTLAINSSTRTWGRFQFRWILFSCCCRNTKIRDRQPAEPPPLPVLLSWQARPQ